MKNFIRSLLFTIILCPLIFAQDSSYTFSGLMFGDYYWVPAHHDSSVKNSNGFWFRRIYLTYEHTIHSAFSARIRLEMASAGDFSTSSVPLIPFIKDAYMKWTINQDHQAYLGISQPPTLTVIEKIWNYRFIEKTPLDLQRWAPSRDFGVAIRGKFLHEDKLHYHVMLANGSGNKSETNSGKKIMASVSYDFTKNFVFEAYVDCNDCDGSNDFFTYQGFLAFYKENMAIGLQYAHQTRHVPGDKDEELDLLSAFVRFIISDKLGIVTRIDRMFTPNPLAARQWYLPFDPTAKSTLYILGVDYIPVKQVHITPNIEIIVYDINDEGIKPGTDVMPRITFYYKFI